ncbi:MAG: nucleoside triphosphate hydrolase [Mesorhizobium sp.]|nr:nucleoside triphosphate hydrolase [Mesorhizobium sp.]
MSEIAHIAAQLFRRAAGRQRLIVAIAGPPGSGKSTLAEALHDALVAGGQSAAVVAMDGFHFDDSVLRARGQHDRKGAPETFDVAGFEHLLGRLRAREADVAVPVFDRSIEIARAGGAIVGAEARIVLVEGNYLLLDEEPWRRLGPMIDVSIFLDVPRDELERRLIRRWLELGHSPDEARAKALSNDIPNAQRVLEKRRPADIVI